MEKRKEIKWINCAKTMAILAVMTDHTNGVLYSNYKVAYVSSFSVSLFIVIAGMMNYLSNERHELGWFQTFVKSSKRIVVAYLVANSIYLIWSNHYFDMRTYLQYVISFNLSGPFYYVLLYLQLMLISRFLYGIVKRVSGKRCWMWEAVIGIFILFISSFTTNYTNVLNVYGGGGKILGGTYLFLFYLGMIISKHDIFQNITLKKSLIMSVVGFALWFVWWQFACYDKLSLDSKLPFGEGFNPPSVTFGIMALTMLVFTCGVFSLFEYSKHLNWITIFVSWIGKHTLYIFLYHRFFLDYVLRNWGFSNNIWMKRIVYFSVMIFGSIILDYFFCYVKKILVGSNPHIHGKLKI